MKLARARNLPVGVAGKLMTDLVDLFEPVKLRSSNSENTKAEWRRKFKRYKEWMASWKVGHVTVSHLDELLEEKASGWESYRTHRLLIGELCGGLI